MHIRVPSTLPTRNRPPVGLSAHDMLTARFAGLGYGEDDSTGTFDTGTTDTGSTIDTSTLNLATSPGQLMTGTLATLTGDTGSTGFGPGGVLTADQMNTIETGGIPTDLTSAQAAALIPYSTPVGTIPASPTTANLQTAGFSASQAASLLTAAAQTALATYKATQTPGLIPGTNLIYNPATGQVLNAAGSITASSAGLSISGILPILAIAAVAIIFLKGRN